MLVGSTWRASRHSQCRSRQAITLPEGNLRGVGDGAGFPGQDAYTSLHATSPMVHFHGPLVHDLFRRLRRCVWIRLHWILRRPSNGWRLSRGAHDPDAPPAPIAGQAARSGSQLASSSINSSKVALPARTASRGSRPVASTASIASIGDRPRAATSQAAST